MTSQTTRPQSYTIREVARLTGLPASTLRYYESIGITQPIERDESSKHRTYTEDDLGLLTAIACLSATGMSLDNMREYLRYRNQGVAGAAAEIQLLSTQKSLLAEEAKRLAIRRRYVDVKIAYWQAVQGGDQAAARHIASEANGLVKDLKISKE